MALLHVKNKLLVIRIIQRKVNGNYLATPLTFFHISTSLTNSLLEVERRCKFCNTILKIIKNAFPQIIS